MSNPSAVSVQPPHAALLRRVFLLAVLMVEIGIGLAFLAHALRASLSPAVLVGLSDALTGLAAGFSARWLLSRYSGPLRLAAALALLIGGMLLEGWLTGWQVGLGPLELGRSQPDLIGLGQLSLGMGISLLALYAWQRPPLHVEVAPSPPLPVRRPARSRAPGAAANSSPRRAPRTRARTASRAASRLTSKPFSPAPVIVAEKPTKSKRKRTYRRKPQLQFISEEEHRCPYCLDPVLENDPRGTVECKICHTLHHADCWAITGSCQVPHLTV